MELEKKIELKIISKKELAQTLGNKRELYYFFDIEGTKEKKFIFYLLLI